MQVLHNSYLRPFQTEQQAVNNCDLATKLKHRGMDLSGYGTPCLKAIGMRVKVCAPGHLLERLEGVVLGVRFNKVLVSVSYNSETIKVYLTHKELQ